MTPPIRMVSVPPNVLESIAFNLCSLHDFDPAFVQQNERFALAAITEYLRAQPAADPARAGAVTKWAQDSISKLCSGGATLAAAPVREEGGAVSKAMESLRFVAKMERDTDRMASVMVANWIIQDLADREEGGAAQQAIIAFDVEEYVEGYEFRGEEGGYMPTEDERALLTDAIHGVISELSLATREEGGAVLQAFADEVARIAITDDTSGDDAFNALNVVVDYARELSKARPDPDDTSGDLHGRLFRNPALATREEAPAETTDCKTCAGNGEIVTDWDEYLSPPKGAPADHATADCPDCDGIGKVEALAEAGEIDLYDDKVQAGIAWTMRQWGEALGLKTWTQGDGSESVEGDVGAEIHTILVDAGLRDPETNEMAALRAQPQAREEAQPMACLHEEGSKLPDGAISGTDDGQTVWLESSTGGAHFLGMWGGLSLRFTESDGSSVVRDYVDVKLTPPAPEAEKMRILDVVGDYLIQQYGYSYGLHHPVDRKRILVALQAEQKGGA